VLKTLFSKRLEIGEFWFWRGEFECNNFYKECLCLGRMSRKTVEEICRDIDARVLEEMRVSASCLKYVAIVMDEMGADPSSYEGFSFEGRISSDMGIVNTVCRSVAQDFCTRYSEKIDMLADEMWKSVDRDDMDEAEKLCQVSGVFAVRTGLLKTRYGGFGDNYDLAAD
jgi:hypothetical protein